MTTQDKVKVIAEYDEWKLEFYSELKQQNMLTKGIMTLYQCDLKYLTSLDWLHPVAMKVFDELFTAINANNKQDMIKFSMMCNPINGEYIDLFNAVYNGIVFLNSNK